MINEPDDVTICEGEGAVFTCVLNSDIRSDDVQWYRFIKNTNTTVMVDPNINIMIMNRTNWNTTSSSLTITNATKSYTGYFWVGISSLKVCNASLTVLTGMYVCIGVHVCTYVCRSSLYVCILLWRHETCKKYFSLLPTSKDKLRKLQGPII